MEMKLNGVKKAEGEISYLFASIFLSFFIVIYICIIIMTTNYFSIEYHMREIANRISIRSLVQSKNLLSKENIEKEFKEELKNLKENAYLKVDNKILKEFLEGNNFKFEEKSMKDLNIKVFEVIYTIDKPYKIGGILKYKPKSLAYIFITLNEGIKK